MLSPKVGAGAVERYGFSFIKMMRLRRAPAQHHLQRRMQIFKLGSVRNMAGENIDDLKILHIRICRNRHYYTK
jgi:hypothetical protein